MRPGAPPRRRGSQRARREGRRSFWHPRFTHAVEKGLELSEIRWVVARRCPIDAGAGHREGRGERKAGLDRGMRLVQATKLRERGRQVKPYRRMIPIRLDRS